MSKIVFTSLDESYGLSAPKAGFYTTSQNSWDGDVVSASLYWSNRAEAFAKAAEVSAADAAASQTASDASKVAAKASEDEAAAILVQITDQYLGPYPSDPPLTPNGNLITVGDLYFNTISNQTRIYTSNDIWTDVTTVAGVDQIFAGDDILITDEVGDSTNGIGKVRVSVDETKVVLVDPDEQQAGGVDLSATVDCNKVNAVTEITLGTIGSPVIKGDGTGDIVTAGFVKCDGGTQIGNSTNLTGANYAAPSDSTLQLKNLDDTNPANVTNSAPIITAYGDSGKCFSLRNGGYIDMYGGTLANAGQISCTAISNEDGVLGPSQLKKTTEESEQFNSNPPTLIDKTGWRLLRENNDVYGGIGIGASDFSYSSVAATGVDAIPYGATGDYSFCEGITNRASGQYSHAEGNQCVASNTSAHAEGFGTTASGVNTSHAEGANTTASGANGPHAEGYQTEAAGNSSHSEGYYTEVLNSGVGAHSEGQNTRAINGGQHVEGTYNVGTSLNTIHETGMGGPFSGQNKGSLLISEAIPAGNYVVDDYYDFSNTGQRYLTPSGAVENLTMAIVVAAGTESTATWILSVPSEGGRKNGLEVYKDGTVTAPELTTGLIDNPFSVTALKKNRVLITKEYFDANTGGAGGPSLTEDNTWTKINSFWTAGSSDLGVFSIWAGSTIVGDATTKNLFEVSNGGFAVSPSDQSTGPNPSSLKFSIGPDGTADSKTGFTVNGIDVLTDTLRTDLITQITASSNFATLKANLLTALGA